MTEINWTSGNTGQTQSTHHDSNCHGQGDLHLDKPCKLPESEGPNAGGHKGERKAGTEGNTDKLDIEFNASSCFSSSDTFRI